jgi:hypothetical protein
LLPSRGLLTDVDRHRHVDGSLVERHGFWPGAASGTERMTTLPRWAKIVLIGFFVYIAVMLVLWQPSQPIWVAANAFGTVWVAYLVIIFAMAVVRGWQGHREIGD